MPGGAGSKAKGSRGELELCRILGGLLGGAFLRAPGSGAFVGGKNAARKVVMSEAHVRTSKADIVPPDHLPRMVVESKFYAEFPFHLLLRAGPIPLLDSWLAQTLDAADAGDAAFLAFKINGKSWFVGVPEAEAWHYVWANHARYSGASGDWRLADLGVFFSNNREAVLRRAGP